MDRLDRILLEALLLLAGVLLALQLPKDLALPWPELGGVHLMLGLPAKAAMVALGEVALGGGEGGGEILGLVHVQTQADLPK